MQAGGGAMIDIAVRILLWWLSIGSLVWLVLHTIGVVDQVYAARKPAATDMVLATILVIVLWPPAAYRLLAHPQWTFKHLKRKLWGAP